MESDKLYRVTKEDFPRLQSMLTKCFAEDPLYCALIPQKELREKLMPQLFKFDLEEMFSTCEIFADSSELNSILVVSDEHEPYNHVVYHLVEMMSELKTDECLIKEDPSFKTFMKFAEGKEYLNSEWTDELDQLNRIHIIYLAVDPAMQHHEIASHLLKEVISYAETNKLMLSLETHNEKNIDFYKHFGFEVYKVIERHFGLKQYCLVKKNEQ